MLNKQGLTCLPNNVGNAGILLACRHVSNGPSNRLPGRSVGKDGIAGIIGGEKYKTESHDEHSRNG